jgi:hypothetical protein
MVAMMGTLDTALEISCRKARSALKPSISEFSEALRDFGGGSLCRTFALHADRYYPADPSINSFQRDGSRVGPFLAMNTSITVTSSIWRTKC